MSFLVICLALITQNAFNNHLWMPFKCDFNVLIGGLNDHGTAPTFSIEINNKSVESGFYQ